MEDAPRCPGGTPLGLTGLRGLPVGVTRPGSVVCISLRDRHKRISGPFKGPNHTGEAATTGRGSFPEPDDCIAEEDDHSRLLLLEKGTRRKQRVEASHALESVA
ncbi:hypothetical protein NDU88_004545 [Pleurodeles waltl]|uniref:Uncharacterized protein n=1 Tax=Pleurodeles waltl TaxID=8319 RepID=A0AAV7RJX9_PLEWA|nr:hypothetical protein NDU88_004545 [Pleurodeles waltl]